MKRESPYLTANEKQWIKAITIIVVFFAIVFLIVKAATKPKPVATTAQVNDLLTSRGYTVEDSTERYQTGSPGGGIVNVLTVEQDALVFQFFVFDDNNSAMNGYGEITTQISKHRTKTQDVATSGFHGNYIFRTLLANGKYYYLVRVGETIIYATGSENDKTVINDLISSLGYVD